MPATFLNFKNLKEICRWAVLLLLLAWASRYIGPLLEKLKFQKVEFRFFVPLLISALIPFLIRGFITRSIVNQLDKQISLPSACAINVLSGLWNLVFPMGSVGYKAWYLREKLHLKVRSYLGMYLLSSLLAIWISSWVLFSLSAWFDIKGYRLIYLLIALALMAGIFIFEPVLNFLKNKFSDRFQFENPPGTRFVIEQSFYQLLGLLAQGALLYFTFRSFSVDMHPIYVLLMVSFENILLVVALVPGNLVIREAMYGWLMKVGGMSLWSGVITASMMRLVNITVLCSLAFFVYVFKGSLIDRQK